MASPARRPRHGAALAHALQVERARQAGEQPDAELGVVGAERGRRLLEQLDRALIGHARAPARLLVADRRSGEQLRVPALARECRRLPEGVQRLDGGARAVPRAAELEEQVRPVAAAQLERGPEPRGGLVEGERRCGGPRGEHVVLDRALRGPER